MGAGGRPCRSGWRRGEPGGLAPLRLRLLPFRIPPSDGPLPFFGRSVDETERPGFEAEANDRLLPVKALSRAFKSGSVASAAPRPAVRIIKPALIPLASPRKTRAADPSGRSVGAADCTPVKVQTDLDVAGNIFPTRGRVEDLAQIQPARRSARDHQCTAVIAAIKDAAAEIGRKGICGSLRFCAPAPRGIATDPLDRCLTAGFALVRGRLRGAKQRLRRPTGNNKASKQPSHGRSSSRETKSLDGTGSFGNG
jgi:hypothetical protein